MPLPTLRTFATDICETSNTTGVGTYQLAGARTNYRSFAEGYATNDTPYYVVRNADDTKYEHNRGGVFTNASPDTLTRNVLYSSNGGAAVNWDAGDLPLNVYVPNSAEVLEFMIRGWVANSRDTWLKFGHWFDSSVSNIATWKIYDGTSDISLGDIDLVNHKLNFRYMPAGAIMAYAGSTAPAAFLFCQGQTLTRSAYPALFTAIGTTYGAPSGTTFSLPDLRARVPVGYDQSLATGLMDGYVNTLGTKFGTQYHNHSVATTFSTTATGSLTVTGSGTTEVAFTGLGIGNAGSGSSFDFTSQNHQHNVDIAGVTSGTLAVTGSPTGSTSADNQLQPSLVVNFIISTGGV